MRLSDTESEWHLKGEIGGLTRTAQFKVNILSWNEPDNVTFELAGINEPVTGSGEFAVTTTQLELSQLITPAASARNRIQILAAKVWRILFDRIFNGPRSAAPGRTAGPFAGETTLRFAVSVSARGMTGPVLNVLIAPMLKPVAEDLANKIADAINAAPAHAAQ